MVNNQEFTETDHAQIYSKYRPDVSEKIAEECISFLKEKLVGPLDTAIDVGCGSGQSTIILALYFSHVYGFDSSEAQIQEAEKSRVHPNIKYCVNNVELLPFENNSVQLVTACASLHWFDTEKFLKDARRVLSQNGVFLAYTYHKICPSTECPHQTQEVDSLYSELYEILHSYWPEEVHFSLNNYKDIEFPFEEVYRVPKIRQTIDGTVSELVGYIESLSAYQNLKKEDLKKAEELLVYFRDKLLEVLKMTKEQLDTKIKLYRDFYRVMCRKTEK